MITALKYCVAATTLSGTAGVMKLIFANDTSDIISALSTLMVSMTGLVVALIALWRAMRARDEAAVAHQKASATEAKMDSGRFPRPTAAEVSESQVEMNPPTPTDSGRPRQPRPD